MARPKQFDPEATLHDAMWVFWHHGYGATSIRDLEQALGIGRKSLYDTFGDKRQLFLQCLDTFDALPIPITLPEAGWAEIERTFLQAPFMNPEIRSCLMANTILELGASDPELAARSRRHLKRLQAGFRNALNRAAERGDLPRPNDLDQMAAYLTAGMQGLAVMARGGTPPDVLRAIAAQTLATLQQ